MILRLLSVALILLQSACSLDPLYAPVSKSEAPPYPSPPKPPAAPPPAPPPTPMPEAPERASTQTVIQPTPPAVIALMQQAESDRRQGELERAATRLERALRIQPGNAELWHELATIRLQQEQPGLAEELAKKSLSIAEGRSDLIRQNWKLIAQARYQRGDIGGAKEAERRASSPH